jgi:aryl sulfotransferase
MADNSRLQKQSDEVWVGFDFRPGDIVVSTVPKSGTTWMQMICALLVFGTPDLPAPLAELSPFVDAPEPGMRAEAMERLTTQRHRRILKTHTRINRIPQDPEVTYVVVVRHPLDARASLANHKGNIDHREMLRRRGLSPEAEPEPPPIPPMNKLLMSWVDRWNDTDWGSLRNVVRYMAYVWSRRDDPNVVVVHYDDLCADLEGEMRRIAARLGIVISEAMWPQLVEAATFDSMRSNADRIAPDPGLFVNPESFFHRGRSGAGRDALSAAELDRYHARVAQLAPPDLVQWLHRDDFSGSRQPKR